VSPPAPRLFIRKAARADLAEAFRWYEQRRLGLGHEFMRVARVTLAEVARAPAQFPIPAGPVIGRTYSIALNGWLVVGILVGPPALLTAVWLWQRRQRLRAAT
jgi:hypothetical protein